MFLICRVIILIWTRLNQTSYLRNYKNCTLGRHSERSERLPDPPTSPRCQEEELFQKGVLVSPPFIREGTCAVCQWPSNSRVGGKRPERQPSSLSFLILSPCVSKQMEARGFFPPGSLFLAAVATYLLGRGSAGFLFDTTKRFATTIQSPALQCDAITADLQGVFFSQGLALDVEEKNMWVES